MSVRESDQPEPLQGVSLYLAAFVLSLANFTVMLDLTVANVALPHISGSLAVSPSQGTWVLTSYAVADAIMVPLSGWLAMRFGSVRTFLVCLMIFGVASLLCALSNTLGAMVLFRIFQGMGGGPIIPLSQTLTMRIFPKDKQAVGLTLWSTTATIGPVAGPIVGGWVCDNWSWHWIFLMNLPIVFGALLLVGRLLSGRETSIVRQPIDKIGLALLILWVGSLQIILDLGRENDWFNSNFIIGMACIAFIGFLAFVIWEATDEHPVVNIKIFRHKGYLIASVCMPVLYGTYFAITVLTPLWLQLVMGYSATNAGLAVSGFGISAILAGPFAPRLLAKFDVRLLLTISIIWICASSVIRLFWSTDSEFIMIFLPNFLMGVVTPMFYIAITTVALGAVDPDEVTTAAGIINFIRTMMAAIATAGTVAIWESNASMGREESVARMLDQSPLGLGAQSGLTSDQTRSILSVLVDNQALTMSMVNMVYGLIFIMGMTAILPWLLPKQRPASVTSDALH